MASHDHTNSDDDDIYGRMYEQEWVQDLVRKLQDFLTSNVAWLNISGPRILDYACGHGTVSLALINEFPQGKFKGIDNSEAQVRRYNAEAAKLFGSKSQDRMFAVVGDLDKPSAELEGSEWFDFDALIMSMALHHVADPGAMLKQLRRRLKDGGTLILIEILGAKPHAHSHDHQSLHDEHHHLDPDSKLDTPQGEKIWPGFTPEYFEATLTEAGFRDVECKVPEITFQVPGQSPGAFVGDNQLVVVKAIVA